ncbi:MAG: hypothetical protein IKM40_01565 [Clostridia bacterium]|nr:hypothetical protein [Clostridia bacterium]
MPDFSIGMALFDYIPCLFFGIGAVILLRDLYNVMSKGSYALFAAGVVNVFMAGTLKATWKLLVACGVGGFDKLDAMFFPVQTLGFLFAGIAIVWMLAKSKKAHRAMEPLTLICIIGMVGGLAMLDTGLCILAKKVKKPALIAIFAVSFVCCLGMGYLSSKDFDQASMNWIAEGVNFFGQGFFALGAYLLSKAGLASVELDK